MGPSSPRSINKLHALMSGGGSTRKVFLACTLLAAVTLQCWRMFHHHHIHNRDLNDMEWMNRPRHEPAPHPECPTCAPACEECPTCATSGAPALPIMSAAEVKQRWKVDPSWPASAVREFSHLRDKMVVEQQLRRQAQADLKEVTLQRNGFEERLRLVKHALAESAAAQGDGFSMVAAEKSRCSMKLYELMTRSLKNRIYAEAVRKGNTSQLELELLDQWASASFPSPPPVADAAASSTSSAVPASLSTAAFAGEQDVEILNESMAEMAQRRLRDAVADLQAQGWTVPVSLWRELEGQAASRGQEGGTVEGVEDGVERARNDWLDALKASKSDLLQNVDLIITNHTAKARLVTRTPDAERIFPILFPNSTLDPPALPGPPPATAATTMLTTTVGTAAAKPSARRRRGNVPTVLPPPPRAAYTHLDLTVQTSNTAPEYGRCAIVGNSQRLLLRTDGPEIDAHDVVIRLNNAPTLGFEPFVGSKTTHRLVNNQWTRTYSAMTRRLPLEWNVTLLASRTEYKSYTALFQQLKTVRSDIAVVRLTMEGVNKGGEMLRKIGARIERWRGLEYAGKGSPSSGMVAVYLMMQMCASLSVYGVGLEGCAGECAGSTAWHYWQDEEFRTSREFGEVPHHSFELEHDVLRLLHAGNYLRLVNPERQRSMLVEKHFLSERQPLLIQAAADVNSRAKLDADMKCAASTGSVCGCPRTCVTPTNTFLRQLDTRMKLEKDRIAASSKTAEINFNSARWGVRIKQEALRDLDIPRMPKEEALEVGEVGEQPTFRRRTFEPQAENQALREQLMGIDEEGENSERWSLQLSDENASIPAPKKPQDLITRM